MSKIKDHLEMYPMDRFGVGDEPKENPFALEETKESVNELIRMFNQQDETDA